MSIFSKNLKNARINKKVSQKKIAKYLDLTESGYAHWEQGRTEPDTNTIIKICKILEISPNELFGYDDILGFEDYDETKADITPTQQIDFTPKKQIIIPIAARSKGNKVKVLNLSQEELRKIHENGITIKPEDFE